MKTEIKKELQKGIPSNKFNVLVIDKRLAFKTIADYEKIVNEPSEINKMMFLQEVKSLKGFTSFAQKQNPSSFLSKSSENLKNLIKDDYFASILNSDLAVQIGSNIFKINPIKEKVYMLPVKNADQYKDLISEKNSNKNIQVYSTGDDVLEIIKSNGNKSLFCHESGIGSYHAFSGVVKVGNVNISGHLYFNRFGIYFSLFAEAVAALNGVIVVTADIEPVYYHVKCKNTVGPYNVKDYGAGNTLNLKRYQSYQGSRNLNEVFIRAKFKGTYSVPPNFVRIQNETQWIQIRVNY